MRSPYLFVGATSRGAGASSHSSRDGRKVNEGWASQCETASRASGRKSSTSNGSATSPGSSPDRRAPVNRFPSQYKAQPAVMSAVVPRGRSRSSMAMFAQSRFRSAPIDTRRKLPRPRAAVTYPVLTKAKARGPRSSSLQPLYAQYPRTTVLWTCLERPDLTEKTLATGCP